MTEEERKIREDEQGRIYEAIKNREHYYFGPDCLFCGHFGPADEPAPCFDPQSERLKLVNLLRNCDFWLDEFGSGACRVGAAESEVEKVPAAVELFTRTMRLKLIQAQADLRAKACWRDCKCEPRRMETAEARVEVLRQAIMLLKHRDIDGHPCFCFLWPDEEPHCEAETGNDICKQVQEALKYPNEGYPMPLMERFAQKSTIEYLEEQAKVDGPVFNAGRSEGRADVAVELRKIIDPNDEQHLSLDGTLDIVRKMVNLL